MLSSSEFFPASSRPATKRAASLTADPGARMVAGVATGPAGSLSSSMAATLSRSGVYLLPGLLVCAVVTLAALALERAEVALFGHAWLESLVLAIVLGTILRSVCRARPAWAPGIRFAARFLLEAAVMLLGASLSAATILAHGPALIAGIALVVSLAIACSYGIGRLLGLPRKMAVLIACGNSICGNSAIAAVAPVIGASSDEVATSIGFTAVLGVLAVVCLPILAPLLSFSAVQYGVFAGLTVYAVPQVLAATAPVALASVQIGTLVKLVRVLMLGPVLVCLGLLVKKNQGAPRAAAPVLQAMPWFILGFLLLMGLRTADLIPSYLLQPAHSVSAALTIMSMAALGLGVDLGAVLRAGVRVSAVVLASLMALGLISYGLIAGLGLP
ncbi:MAG: YeiH family protein [Janthinobacterium lividum]